MLSELGNFLLVMALGFASVQVLASFWGVVRNACSTPRLSSLDDNEVEKKERRVPRTPHYLTLGRITAFLQGGFLSGAFLTLIIAFLVCDFSISTVAFHGHTQLPWYYRCAAAWGNHEGSLLLFVLILSGVGMALAVFLRDPLFQARALVFQGLLTVLFILFLIMTSNPFTPLPFTLPQGSSLNPLLQDKGLLIHPPLLYLGYVGFSAPFSLALAALWGREDVTTWGTLVRPWALIAWGALTAGITLGSWWAYYELGWGGWWFWDPVENASFMPWLAGTALLHTLLTGKLYRWSLFLSLLTFGLSLLGTFLVRSGLIVSVHSFAQSPERGVFILSLIGGIMGFAFFLWSWKAPRLQGTPLLLFSRQGALLLNSLLLCVGLATVILGTFYPLWSDWMWQEKVAIGAPYFERTLVPLMVPLLLLIPLGSLFREKGEALFPFLITPLTAVLGAALLILYFLHPFSLWAFTGIILAIWILIGMGVAFFQQRLSLGPTLAHMGVALSLFGVSVGAGFRSDETRILALGESLEVGGIKLTLQDVHQGKSSTYLYEKAILTFPGGRVTPEKRLYQPQNSLLSETAISTNGIRDLYVILGSYQGENRWLIRASIIPFAPWIWLGGALMVLGAAVSFFNSKCHPREGGDPDLASEIIKKSLFENLLGLDPRLRGDDNKIKQSKAPSSTLRTKIKKLILLFFLILPISSSADTTLENRAHTLSQEVRCPVCLGQSIAESETEESEALKIFILQRLKEGESEEEIRAKLRSLYSDEILFRPPFEGHTWFLWIAPFGFFFFILMIFLWKSYIAYKE